MLNTDITISPSVSSWRLVKHKMQSLWMKRADRMNIEKLPLWSQAFLSTLPGNPQSWCILPGGVLFRSMQNPPVTCAVGWGEGHLQLANHLPPP